MLADEAGGCAGHSERAAAIESGFSWGLRLAVRLGLSAGLSAELRLGWRPAGVTHVEGGAGAWSPWCPPWCPTWCKMAACVACTASRAFRASLSSTSGRRCPADASAGAGAERSTIDRSAIDRSAIDRYWSLCLRCFSTSARSSRASAASRLTWARAHDSGGAERQRR